MKGIELVVTVFFGLGAILVSLGIFSLSEASTEKMEIQLTTEILENRIHLFDLLESINDSDHLEEKIIVKDMMNKTSDRYESVFKSVNSALISSSLGLIMMVGSATFGFAMLFKKSNHE